ncbi:Transcriptional regulator, AsnC family [Saccharolobus shibatae B12]|uniref:Transcriptional regulator, AsnC family n=1 Tax=Saccharolobus shibatae (strain ATCC 51178 / DSM 5389 / JCM 8931 / NBRC 15437 / B12) TaxID=523848 RepID=A0A8F5BPH9_SACSH|nr:Lrp/AsnC family transcriptional regulator [Saccharolobus shibatae]QXJ29046.1 Transcriptional regulator, AsnC family [Saccharolobus shibatae B12]
MDEIDRKILFYLLKDGRISQNKLAKLLNISSPSINARFRRLLEEGILRDFKLFVNPNIYGKYFMYVAFPNLRDMEDDRIFVKFRCLENFNVYGIEAENLSELDRVIEGFSLTLGSPIMKYAPSQNLIIIKKNIAKILSILSENPRAEIREIALKTGYKAEKIRRILLKLKEIVRIVPEVDLIKADSLLLGIFTKKLEEIKRFTVHCSVITIDNEEGEGVEICFTGGIKESKNIVDLVRRIDPYAQVMLVYDYTIRGIKAFSNY